MFFTVSALRSPLFHGMNSYVRVSILNNICRIGMMRVNENMLNMAENTLSSIAPPKYFLYGATKRFINCQNSFITKSLKQTSKIVVFP